MEDAVRRIPPHSLEAEQSVIAAMIMDNDIVDDVFVLIKDSDFYHPDLKIIFNAIRKLRKLNKAIDLVTLKEIMQDDYVRIGGNEYLSQLVMNIHTTVHYPDHCKIIKEKSYMRTVIKFSHELMTSAYESDLSNISNVLTDIPVMDALNDIKHKNTMAILQDTVNDVFERMQKEGDDLRGLPTGIPSLDKFTGGMKPGEIIGVKAPPNVGKSVFCVNICQHLAKKGIETGYFAYEMVGVQFGYRLASSEWRVPIDALVNPKDGLKNKVKSLSRIKKYDDESINNLHIFPSDQLPQKSLIEIESRLRLFTDIKLIVVDYLQLMKHPTATGFEAYTENLRDLKALAAKYYIPVIVILGETKTGEIRGTQEIEHDLDQLYELTRNKYGETKEERQKTFINNKKGRDGKICKVPVCYFEDYIMFREVDKDGNTG